MDTSKYGALYANNENETTNSVTPVYYVLFTTATIIASVILFQGFNDATTVQVSILRQDLCLFSPF